MTMSQLGYTLGNFGNIILRGADRLSTILTTTFIGFNPGDNAQCQYFSECPTNYKFTIGCRDHFGDWHKSNCGFYRRFYIKQLIGGLENDR
ncbi:hypothetical protein HY212_04095 [Candidatus Pacearchaeota archaeon]|nr:hypothetical protein [Candidatus Pacearchaeota archaeon]